VVPVGSQVAVHGREGLPEGVRTSGAEDGLKVPPVEGAVGEQLDEAAEERARTNHAAPEFDVRAGSPASYLVPWDLAPPKGRALAELAGEAAPSYGDGIVSPSPAGAEATRAAGLLPLGSQRTGQVRGRECGLIPSGWSI
jgi:hypothetical protein